MKKYFLIYLLCISFLGLSQNFISSNSVPTIESASNEKVSIVQVFIGGHEQLHDLDALDIGADHIHYNEDGAIELYLTQNQIKKLADHGFNYKIEIDDYHEFFSDRARREAPYINTFEKMKRTASNFDYGSMGGFYTYDEMVGKLDEMKTLYPNIVKAKYSIGKSIENRTIWALKISDNPDIDEDEPVVYYDALHHAREPLSMAVTINYMFWLLENYTTNPQVAYIIDNRELYFVPIVNPDGYVYNQTTNPNGGGLWRKNRRDNNDSTFGVDLNRNYSHAYDHDSSCSSNASISNTYSGTGPFSEPETQAVRDFVDEINPAVAFSSHSTAGKYLMPYGYDTAPPEFKTYSEWASDFLSDNNYPYGVTFQMLGYSTCGTTRDYLHNEGIYGWTPEIGGSGFWPAQSEIFGRVDENVGPLFYQAWICGGFADFQSHTTTGAVIPGGDFAMSITLKNKGVGSDASDIKVNLEPSSPLIKVSTTQSFPNIVQQTKVDNSESPFIINIDPTYTDGTVNIDAVITQNGVESSRETITIFVGARTNLFSDDAESGASNWTATGNGITWGLIQDDSYGGTYSFGDSNGGNCENNTTNYFTLNHVLDLSNTVKPIINSFNKWSLDIGDSVELQISTNGGSNYTTLKTYTLNNKWTQESIDLSAYNGNANVKLRYFLSTNGDTNADGFYFDDFSIDNYDCLNCALCDVFVDDYPAIESFEAGTGAWSQIIDGSDDMNWTAQTGTTPSSGTGPNGAADGSMYLYIEASTSNDLVSKAILESPCYDFRNSKSAALNFQYHMNGSNTDMNLKVEISIDKGSSWTNAGFAVAGNQGDQWNIQSIDLTDYIGQMVSLRIIGMTGDSWQGDVAIDNLEVIAEICDCATGDICDDDNDGICNEDDLCPDLDDMLIGTPCDDGDECTSGEVYDISCLCSGGTFQDMDGDNICDSIDPCPNDFFNTCNTLSYCSSHGKSTNHEYINQVILNDLDHTSGDNAGYKDFMHLSTNLRVGKEYTIQLVPGFSSGSFEEFWGVWIDYNQDGNFDDNNEHIVNTSSTSSVSNSFVVPNGLLSKARMKMRVSMKYGNPPTACEIFSDGEVEDYTIIIESEDIFMEVSDPNQDTYGLADFDTKTTIHLRNESYKQKDLSAISLYPNPANQKLFLDTKGMFDTEEKLFITIYGMDGKLSIKQTINASDVIEIDLSSLGKSQQYFLKLTTFAGETFTHTFMKVE